MLKKKAKIKRNLKERKKISPVIKINYSVAQKESDYLVTQKICVV
jgi:hypothetical protein